MLYALLATICLMCSLINVPSALQGNPLSIFAMIFCFGCFIVHLILFTRHWWE